MATIHVDGKEYQVNGAENLLQACLSMGLDIPYFCWHPALGSVGACRQCAVKQYQNAEDTRGRLVMSCMTPAADGTFISIDDAEAREFRESVVEWLMTNHPHDCPVCEEGGNCHLQDMTVMTGHAFRRYRFTKRTHQNQDLGPFISHEMNRCIACYRCVRYYKDYAGGTDLGVYGAHDNVYFGRTESGTLESEFSGNLVEVCPTGVFTDKTHSERYNRKWDMQYAPSICQQCSIGCNTSPGERYGELRRIENRFNGSVNHYFLCDRGRFGYGYVNRDDRPRHPQQRHGDNWVTLNAEQAITVSADLLRQAKRVIGIGSGRASIESNFALQQLVGQENFSTGMPVNEQRRVELIIDILQNRGLYTPSLREIEQYDAVLVLGEDLTQVGARVALSVRQAVKGKARELAAAQKVADWQIAAILNIGQHAKHPLFMTSAQPTRLDDIAAWNYCAAVEDQARLGFAIAHAIDASAPAVENFDTQLHAKVDVIVQALSGAKKPLIIAGTHAGSDELLHAAANIAQALKAQGSDVGITLLAPQANSIGVGLLGGKPLEEALDLLVTGEAEAVVIMENDLYRHLPAATIDAALDRAEQVVVLDHQATQTVEQASILLSAASFAEADGTLINQEGRAQRFFQVYDPAYYDTTVTQLESWRWLHALERAVTCRQTDWSQLDNVIDAVISEKPFLNAIKEAAPDASFRIRGQKLARSPHRSSGRTAMRANISVHEPRQPQDKDTMFAFSMEGNNQPDAPRSQIPFAWSPGWNSPQAWNKFQDEVGGHLRHGDPGVRLFNGEGQPSAWFTTIPAAYQPQEQWRVVPLWRLFGSEELSQRSAVFEQRMTPAEVVLHPDDAAKLGLETGQSVQLQALGVSMALPLRISASLSRGLIGLPVGMPGIPPYLSGAEVDMLQEAQA
ncbi:NADH-quinone oxidoreductase subunit NuoG [Rosenbergiella australiborealis]|uniref:NADH-quinone oxidoreductase n=1 Tax=Rosenbergiella australiborealis TaxID=1544696 RepID=A0ABS5T4S4_9GAMM|nr:NADH-quinone oxidoreductase subunit NuoG [Rosenbergiella australiborealis]MBT0726753.1 NADH-quinone oxidoreductase subunit NuoG [Rosenbergiella australiborealis]